VHLDRGVQLAGEVGHDHDRTPQHADEQEVATDVVGVDLGGHLTEPRVDLLLRQQHLLQVAAHVLSVHTSSSSVATPVQSSRAKPSLPHPREATTPPGNAAGPGPRYAATRVSRAATWREPSAPPGTPAASAARR